MNLRSIIIASTMSSIFFFGCGGNQELPPLPTNEPQPQTQATPVVEAPKEKPVYVYAGDKFRDPFTPAGLSTSYSADAVFDPQRATVRGIIFGPRLKSAVLAVGGTGIYFVKESRIFDVMGKTVDGFTAKVLEDKVVVLGEADNTFELKIRDDEEEES